MECPKQKYNFSEATISHSEFTEILDSLFYENERVSIRNRFVIKVLWETGIRINELLGLKWEDVVNDTISVVGKGDKKRLIPVKKDLFVNEGSKKGFIFLNKNFEQLGYGSINALMSNVKKILQRSDVSAHTFRHSFATRIIKSGIPLPYVSKLLGHSSVNTTMLYIHFNIKDIRKELLEKDWN
ncbi:MAG: site-specific integrase [Mycoplasmataceae bacterium]|nr:site-specific integrase [Mycoplasmataceae bacterium]